jgi:hypothetical protein
VRWVVGQVVLWASHDRSRKVEQSTTAASTSMIGPSEEMPYGRNSGQLGGSCSSEQSAVLAAGYGGLDMVLGMGSERCQQAAAIEDSWAGDSHLKGDSATRLNYRLELPENVKNLHAAPLHDCSRALVRDHLCCCQTHHAGLTAAEDASLRRTAAAEEVVEDKRRRSWRSQRGDECNLLVMREV